MENQWESKKSKEKSTAEQKNSYFSFGLQGWHKTTRDH